VVPEPAAKGLGNMHKFVNYRHVLLRFGHSFEPLEEFYDIKGLGLQGQLHDLRKRMASGDRPFGLASGAPDANDPVTIDVRKIQPPDDIAHPPMKIVCYLILQDLYLSPKFLKSSSKDVQRKNDLKKRSMRAA